MKTVLNHCKPKHLHQYLFYLFFASSVTGFSQNNTCGSATTLPINTGCATDYTFTSAATYTTITAPGCGGTNRDMWYTFVAQSASANIMLSNATIANLRIELYTGTCTAGLTSVACGSGTNITTSSLTIGTTYYVRVYTSTSGTGTFRICMTIPDPPNDLCANAVILNSASTCTITRGALTQSNWTTVTPIGCGVTNRNDVWYQFEAKSPNPTITLTTSMINPRLQIFTGSCGSLTSVACTNGTMAATGLTVGTIYYIRVYTDPNVTGTFTICVTDPVPVNDNCAGAVVLTSGLACTNTKGYLQSSSLSTTPVVNPFNCAGTVAYDVWYRFVAQTTSPTITLSNLGSGFAATAHIQLLSLSNNNCATGTYTSLYCSATGAPTIAADYLTVGSIYYIRVFSTTGTAPANGSNLSFDICVTDPVATTPYNDECANAVNLTTGGVCSGIPGSIAGATLSSGIGTSCAAGAMYDVWFRFTATTATTDVNLSGAGANFTNTGIEVFSGTCGSLTSISCNAASITNITTTPGNVYYVRVYSTTAQVPNGNAMFNICARGNGAAVRFGNSYVNISKKSTGGVVQVGDTLEIRMTINNTGGTFFNPRFVDNVPSNTQMLTGIADSIRIITNEGLTYKKYSLAAGDDAGTYLAAPPAGQFNIRLNLALGAFTANAPANNTVTETASATGQLQGTQRPRGNGSLLFAIAYRVRVTGNLDDTIKLNPAQFVYRTVAGGPDITVAADTFKILISVPQTLCANSLGLNNALEDGGTFGRGTSLNRNADLSSPISRYTFVNNTFNAQSIFDGRYGIVKNISPRNSTNRTARRIPNCDNPAAIANTDPDFCDNRSFKHWDIDGDHTGTNDAIGNAPPAKNADGGYMLLVNADFIASEAYRQTINNLCPDTYYEFSAWIRNVCPTCGADSTGAQFAGTTTAPSAGYPGVYPNLSFAVDGIDRYSTGEVDANGWQKRGFVFRTGSNQTSATLSIRNNSQGGGGNDWAMDDISVSTCLPSMSYSPTLSPSTCRGNVVEIRDTVRSYFPNYEHYKWQRSTDDGTTWSDIAGTSGNSTPVIVNGEWQFITSYTIPNSATTAANDGDRYRVVVSTTAANLTDNSCQITDGVSIINLTILDCDFDPLSTDLLSFNGRKENGIVKLNWSTSFETEPLKFQIEKSTNSRNFYTIGTINSYQNSNASLNNYIFNDTASGTTKLFYRIAMSNQANEKVYSRTIQLNTNLNDFSVGAITNPFKEQLQFEVNVTGETRLEAALLSLTGTVLHKQTYAAVAGYNSFSLRNLEALPAGVYLLQIGYKEKIITKKVVRY